MSLRNWMLGVAASVMPWIVQAEDRVFDDPQRVDGLAVYLDFQPAAMAADWAGFHRPTNVDTVVHTGQSDLDRHIVVVLFDEKAGRRVDHAAIEVVVPRTGSRAKPSSHQLERMTSGTNSSYGTVVTIDPAARYEIEVVVRRPGMKHESRVRFDTQAPG
jgi:hypothetical protein